MKRVLLASKYMASDERLTLLDIRAINEKLLASSKGCIHYGGSFVFLAQKLNDLNLLFRYKGKSDILLSIPSIHKFTELLKQAFGHVTEDVIKRNFVNIMLAR